MPIEIHLPPISDDQVSRDLVWLTKHLSTSGAAEKYVGGILGGEYGYGVEFENETFAMHPFCWCERDDCPWCWGCECPDDATRHFVAGREVGIDEWLAAYDEALRETRTWERVPERLCDYCRGERESAPNFLHKPTGTRVSWYKYIGRSMETDVRGDWRAILTDCANSLS